MSSLTSFENCIFFVLNRIYALTQCSLTFFLSKKSIPSAICTAIQVNVCKLISDPSARCHVFLKSYLLILTNSNKDPFEQYSKMTSRLSCLVQAPRTFTTFLCSPICISSFNSFAKSLYSVSVALP